MNPKDELWLLIQDLIGPAFEWPSEMQKYFWQSNVKHFDRLLIATFVYVNGLHPDIFMKWVDMTSMCRDNAAREHLVYLSKRFHTGDYLHTMYGFNIVCNEFQYLDGRKRKYIKKNNGKR
jgi:hypothetical protein